MAVWRSRSHCEDPKKNSLFFLIGPPKEKPKVLSMSTGLVTPASLSSAGIAATAEFRWISQADPWNLLVPPL